MGSASDEKAQTVINGTDSNLQLSTSSGTSAAESRSSSWFKAGLITSLIFTLAFMTSIAYFHVYLPNYKESGCQTPRMYPNFYVVPMLLPEPYLSRAGLIDEFLSDDNYKVQKVADAIRSAGISEYAFKYRLLRFNNREMQHPVFRPNFQRNVVLYIPGSKGHFGQVRSFGSEGSKDSPSYQAFLKEDLADFYTVDFNEEFSAGSADILFAQAIFVNDCIKTILNIHNADRYSIITSRADQEGVELLVNNKTKVVLVGHSYGGAVARLLPFMHNFDDTFFQVETIITLSSPVVLPVTTHDKKLNDAFTRMNSAYKSISQMSDKLQKISVFPHKAGSVLKIFNKGFVKENYDSLMSDIVSKMPAVEAKVLSMRSETNRIYYLVDVLNHLNSLLFVSISGGARDVQVPEFLSDLEGLHSHQLSTSIDNAKQLGLSAVDHLAVVWCKQVVKELVQSIYYTLKLDFVERSSVHTTSNKKTKLTENILSKRLRDLENLTNTQTQKAEEELEDGLDKSVIQKIEKYCYDWREFGIDYVCLDHMKTQFKEAPENFEILAKYYVFKKKFNDNIIQDNYWNQTGAKYIGISSRAMTGIKAIDVVLLLFRNVAITGLFPITMVVLLLALGTMIDVNKQKDRFLVRNIFNPGLHMNAIFRTMISTDAVLGFIPRGLLVAGMSTMNASTIGIFEKTSLYFALCGICFVAFSLLDTVFLLIDSLLYLSLGTSFSGYKVLKSGLAGILLASVSLVAMQFSLQAEATFGLDLFSMNTLGVMFFCGAVYLLIMLCCFVLLYPKYIDCGNGTINNFNRVLGLLYIVSLTSQVPKIVSLGERFFFMLNAGDNFNNIFPARNFRSPIFGLVHGIEGDSKAVSSVQQEIMRVSRVFYSENFLKENLEEDFALVLLLLPLIVHIVYVISDEYFCNLEIYAEESLSRDEGKWKSAAVKSKEKDIAEDTAADEETSVNIKADSFFVEGEVIETKDVLNSHLNKLEGRSAEIVVLDDTKYLEQSKVVGTSEKETVQIDTVKGKASKKKKKSKNSVPLFEGNKNIRSRIKYRKIETKVRRTLHIVEKLGRSSSARIIIESLAIATFFWGPENSWILSYVGVAVASGFCLSRALLKESLMEERVLTKIEYKK